MTSKNNTAYGIKCLECKTARAAIIQKIASNFNLIPLIAEAHYERISAYFAQREHGGPKLPGSVVRHDVSPI